MSFFIQNEIPSIITRIHITGGYFIQRFFCRTAGDELINKNKHIVVEASDPFRLFVSKEADHIQMTGNRQLFSFTGIREATGSR